jgi:hypothetical protein
MGKPEKNQNPNTGDQKNISPDGQTSKSPEFKTFSETLIEFSKTIKNSSVPGLDELKKLFADDPSEKDNPS